MEREKISLAILFLHVLIMQQFLAFAHGQASNTSLTPAMFIFGETMINSENNNSIMTIARENYRHPHGIDFGYPTDRFCNGISAACAGTYKKYTHHFHLARTLLLYIVRKFFTFCSSLPWFAIYSTLTMSAV